MAVKKCPHCGGHFSFEGIAVESDSVVLKCEDCHKNTRAYFRDNETAECYKYRIAWTNSSNVGKEQYVYVPKNEDPRLSLSRFINLAELDASEHGYHVSISRVVSAVCPKCGGNAETRIKTVDKLGNKIRHTVCLDCQKLSKIERA